MIFFQFRSFEMGSRIKKYRIAAPTFGYRFAFGFRDANGRYEYFRMDFRAPFSVNGFNHIVVDIPFDPGRHGKRIILYYAMWPE